MGRHRPGQPPSAPPERRARLGLFVQSLQVNYTAESVAGDELALYVGEAEGVYSVRGVGADSERFEAAAVFAPCPPEA